MQIRTDLALEAKELWEKSAERTTKLAGVRAVERGNVTQVDILNAEGAAALGKPVGRYLTMGLPRHEGDLREDAKSLSEELTSLMHLQPKDRVLVVGLGNRSVTPDALGPEVLRRLFLTRHLLQALPEQFGECRSVSAIAPGVLATTGIESLELVKGAVGHVQPHCVLCIDALAAGSTERLCRTVQCADGGIAPGSGVGNRRTAFSKESLGVPVFSLGVPTVVDGGEGMILTPGDIDAQIRYLSALLASAINLCLHPMFDYDDFTQFVPIYG